jgi:hypothetical protein
MVRQTISLLSGKFKKQYNGKEEKIMAIRILRMFDLYAAAFLSLHKVEPTFEINDGKVLFCFVADDEFFRLMDQFNGNEFVPAAAYATAIKALRGRMLSAKQENGKGYRNGERSY